MGGGGLSLAAHGIVDSLEIAPRPLAALPRADWYEGRGGVEDCFGIEGGTV